MRLLIAPDKFKGSLSSPAVAEAIAEGVRRVLPKAELLLVPMADGGEGTVAALVAATNGTLVQTRVQGPLGEPVEATWGLLGDGETAVIEMAAASGLALLQPEQRDPRRASTYGTGELVRAALDQGRRTLLIGIGGSATNDGGAGLAVALGARLLDTTGQELPPGGAALARLARIDTAGLDPRLREAQIEVASDVTNPLCGAEGASAIYGPQKGATPEMVAELDAALAHWADRLQQHLGKDVREAPGAGAAGGLGAGLLAFSNARLRRGVELVIEAVRLPEQLRGVDLAITGEGQLDEQSLYGKTPVGVARAAAAQGVPTIAIVGGLSADQAALAAAAIAAAIPIVDRPLSLEQAMAQAPRLIADAAERALRLYELGRTWTSPSGPLPSRGGE